MGVASTPREARVREEGGVSAAEEREDVEGGRPVGGSWPGMRPLAEEGGRFSSGRNGFDNYASSKLLQVGIPSMPIPVWQASHSVHLSFWIIIVQQICNYSQLSQELLRELQLCTV